MPERAGSVASRWLRLSGVEVLLGERVSQWPKVRALSSAVLGVYKCASLLCGALKLLRFSAAGGA